MVRTVVITGKGGTGKSTFTALATRVLAEKVPQGLLVVDADPSTTLTQMFGVQNFLTLGDLREELIENPYERRELKKQSTRNYIFKKAVLDLGKFKLLVMGKSEGPGCFCAVNDLLRHGIEALSKDFKIILIDCEAGLEQVNRRIASEIDDLIVMVEPTIRSLQVAS